MKRQPQTFYEHVRELQLRLLISGAALLLGGIVGYVFHKQLTVFLQQPLHDSLYYTSPAGALNYVMKISLLVGIAFALPVFIYNVVSFVQPAVHQHVARKTVKLITALSLVLAIGGALFAFYVVVPMSLTFFGSFKTDNLHSLISAGDYLNFIINCLITFILTFQIPLLLLFLDRIKPIPPKKLLKYERHVIVGSLIFALVLPFTYDPLTQFLIALPVIVLYNLSIIFIMLTHRSAKRALSRQARYVKTEPVTPTVLSEPKAALPLAAVTLPVTVPTTHDAMQPARGVRRFMQDIGPATQLLVDLAPEPTIITTPKGVIDPLFG